MNQVDFRRSKSRQIISLIQSGNAPWKKESVGRKSPYNAATDRMYIGANALLLRMNEEEDPRWCTFIQARDRGWKIKSGAKATTVEYWRFDEKQVENGQAENNAKTAPRAFYVNVYHASQFEGIPSLTNDEIASDAGNRAKKILETSGIRIQHNKDGKMAYSVRQDTLLLPEPESFPSLKHYYAAALRGMAVWAGHPSRFGPTSPDKAEPYAPTREYLRVQLASWYVSAHMNLPFIPRSNEKMDAQCVVMLDKNPNEIFRAARDAEKIAEYIMNLEHGQQIDSAMQQQTELTNTTEAVRWARFAKGGYEVSSKGDARFSAIHATLSNGKTIEETYQLDIKGYRSMGNDWWLGKGKPPLVSMSREALYQEYLKLWKQWAEEHPELIHELMQKTGNKVLTDQFAATDISQARALADILAERRGLRSLKVSGPAESMKKPTDVNTLGIVQMQDLFQQSEAESPPTSSSLTADHKDNAEKTALKEEMPVQPDVHLANVSKPEAEILQNERGADHDNTGTRAGGMDSVAADQSEPDQRIQSRSIGAQSDEVPPDGAGRELKRTNSANLAGERSGVQGANRGDSGGLPAAGGNGLSESVSAQDEDRTADTRANKREVNADPAELKSAEKLPVQLKADFRIDDSQIGQGGPKTKYKNNIAAIRLLKELEAEERKAMPDEQKILAKYAGWGALAQVFDFNPYRNQEWHDEYKELQAVLTPEEYAAARRSILNAYYTSPSVVKGMWKIAEHLGFAGGRVLEPSMGVGNFFGLMPEKLAEQSQLYGIELDDISGRVARQLYPSADIAITGFEKVEAPDNFYDLAISNVPFGDYKLKDPRYDKSNYNIHNYFFAKAMDKVRPGGLVMFITSTGTMQSGGDSELLRRQLAGKVDLVGAVRLPDTAFKASAGTEVTTDIIVLQKRVNEKIPAPYAKKWQKTVPSGIISKYGNRDLEINEYYDDHKDHLIGNLREDTLYGGRGRLALDGKDVDIEAKLNELVAAFPAGIYAKEPHKKHQEKAVEKFLAPAGIREKSYFMQDGKTYQKCGGEGIEVSSAKQVKTREFVQLKTTLKNLLTDQLNPGAADVDLEHARHILNEQYDGFAKKYGYVNADKNIRDLNDDPEFGMVASVEDYRIDKKTKKVSCTKRDIFFKRTIGAVKKIEHADTASDALAASLSEYGQVDMTYMSRILRQSETEIIHSLSGIIYRNPVTRGWETADEYLSGNVREKLEIAKAAALKDAVYAKNVGALEKIQPVWLEAEDIFIGLGMPWLPDKGIQEFADTLMKRNASVEVTYSAALREWNVGVSEWSDAKTSVSGTQTWGTKCRSFPDLLSDALNQRTPTIYKADPYDDSKRVVDQTATQVTNEKIEKIKKEFERWIWQDEERRTRIVAYYNQHFNSWRLREYDGAHLTLPGYSLLAPPLNKHQKDAIWRTMQDGNTLLGHCVGAGKTWTMQAAGMEMRRLGICKKPMYVIPSSLVEQFEKEFREIYPTAKILTVSAGNLPDVTLKLNKNTSEEEAEKKRADKSAKRQEMLSRIAMEDWDGVIISHDMFKRIPMSDAAYQEFYREQINQLEEALLEIANNIKTSNSSSKRMRKNIEKAKLRMENKLESSMKESSKDIVIPFEQLGIDQIFVDEADLFKNLYFSTKMERISGLANSDAQRSMDMFVKTQYLTKINNGRGVVFATGTPISNTMAEMFTMMRYLDMDNLKRKGLDYFDCWTAQFAKTGVAVERSPDGNGYRKVTKIASFVNAPELIKMFRKFADIKQADELNLKRPKLKHGQRTIISVDAGDDLDRYIKFEIFGRAQSIRNGCDPREDNMLKLTSDLRKASLDMRLIDPAIPAEDAAGKLQLLVEQVFAKYEDSHAINGTQMIFCDLSTPKGVSDKSDAEESKPKLENEDFEEKDIVIYDEIKKMLQTKGIPKDEIAFIHDAKTKEQKLRLIEAVNEGKIRVLLGSTGKLGAGTNAQKRLVALHHLDCPWRPRDIEQREGRILRQGNMNEEVEIFTYVTKGSFDANMWEKIKNKAVIISQAMSSNLVQRKIEDMDAAVLSYAEAEALASGNPLMAEKTLLDADVIKYSMLQNEYSKHLWHNERRIQKLPQVIQATQKAIDNITFDIQTRKPILSESFSAKIEGKVYTNRSDAEKALQEAMSCTELHSDRVIGEMGGFAVHIFKCFSESKIKLVGKHTYEARSDSIRSAEYALMNFPEAALNYRKEEMRNLQKELVDLKEQIQRPFEYDEKLKELLARQAEIMEEIDRQTEGNSLVNSVDSMPAAELPENLYRVYLDKMQAVHPSTSMKNIDRYVVRGLNRAGYDTQKIKECLNWSTNLKDLEPNEKSRKIERLIREVSLEHAI